MIIHAKFLHLTGKYTNTKSDGKRLIELFIESRCLNYSKVINHTQNNLDFIAIVRTESYKDDADAMLLATEQKRIFLAHGPFRNGTCDIYDNPKELEESAVNDFIKSLGNVESPASVAHFVNVFRKNLGFNPDFNSLT